MRYVTLRVSATDGYFHPVDRALVEADGVAPEAIHSMEPLDQDTCLFLTEVSGDPDRIRSLFASIPEVLECSVAAGDDERNFCYSRVENTDLTAAMVRRRRNLDVVTDVPVEFTADGDQLVTFVGDAETMAGHRPDPPDGIEVTVEEVGEFGPDQRRLAARLTDRQRDVLAAAVSVGYYDVPRGATQADVAEAADCSAGTVGEHLRKVEAAVLPELVR